MDSSLLSSVLGELIEISMANDLSDLLIYMHIRAKNKIGLADDLSNSSQKAKSLRLKANSSLKMQIASPKCYSPSQFFSILSNSQRIKGKLSTAGHFSLNLGLYL